MGTPVIAHFPTWRYHRTEAARVVQTQEELEQLGDDWYASPADIPDASPASDNATAATAADADDKKKKGKAG